jgi:2-polyprenyl-3-methyl-5-hydroxy-6-metoxy-1,4-benzoquinol methylase
MIDFEKRFLNEKSVITAIASKYNIRSAVDAGCGTGFYSLLLAWLGVKVTAADVSSEMISRLKQHATEMKLNVEIVLSDFQHLADVVHQKVDAVFCLGNTLPHLLSNDDLLESLRGFKSLLNSNGILILQLLNYQKIMKQQVRIQNVKERGGKTFVRFYDYQNNTIAFNILTLERNGNQIVHHLQTTTLNPLTSSHLTEQLTTAGFKQVVHHGSLSLEPFDEVASHDLVIVAH